MIVHFKLMLYKRSSNWAQQSKTKQNKKTPQTIGFYFYFVVVMILTRILRTQLVAINLGISARSSQVDLMLDWHRTLVLLCYIVFCIDVLELHYTFPLDSMNELKEVEKKIEIKNKTNINKNTSNRSIEQCFIRRVGNLRNATRKMRITGMRNNFSDANRVIANSMYVISIIYIYTFNRESNVQFHCAFSVLSHINGFQWWEMRQTIAIHKTLFLRHNLINLKWKKNWQLYKFSIRMIRDMCNDLKIVLIQHKCWKEKQMKLKSSAQNITLMYIYIRHKEHNEKLMAFKEMKKLKTRKIPSQALKNGTNHSFVVFFSLSSLYLLMFMFLWLVFLFQPSHPLCHFLSVGEFNIVLFIAFVNYAHQRRSVCVYVFIVTIFYGVWFSFQLYLCGYT